MGIYGVKNCFVCRQCTILTNSILLLHIDNQIYNSIHIVIIFIFSSSQLLDSYKDWMCFSCYLWITALHKIVINDGGEIWYLSKHICGSWVKWFVLPIASHKLTFPSWIVNKNTLLRSYLFLNFKHIPCVLCSS